MQTSFEGQIQAYSAIKSEKSKFGVFHKTCFHIHTPESHDYCLLDSWDSKTYKSKCAQDILDACHSYMAFPTSVTLDYFDDSLVEGFNDKKELLSFLLLANEILVNEVSIAIVSDHHTIAGVPKLKKAIDYLYHMKTRKVYPEVLLGIEISCADRNHVVGIFDNTDKVKSNINSWLELHLFNEVDGSFETSKEVLEFINSEGGIGYIAHLDTSGTFGEKFLTGAYKRKLFSGLNLVGISDIKKREYIESKIKYFSQTDVNFIVDNDSHNIMALGQKYMWVKGQKRNFQAISEAISDYDICMSCDEIPSNKSYIKGIYVENTDGGYLCGTLSTQPFCMNFSDELNCFIGGRGAGKSTVLELIEYILGQRCKSKEELEFLCAHGNAYILYEYCGAEYLIEMDMPIKGERDNILQCFGKNLEDRYKYYYYYDSDEIKEYALKYYLEVFRVVENNDNILFEKMSDKRNLLRKFFDTRYSVNELVSTAGGESINKFLYDILFENRILSTPESVINIRSVSGLEKMLSDIRTLLEKRATDVNAIIVPFNNAQEGILRIVYTQDNIAHEPPISEWIWGSNFERRQRYIVSGTKYNITYDGIEQYLLSLYSKLGIFEFLSLTLKKDVTLAQKHENILEFCDVMTVDLIEQGTFAVDKNNAQIIVSDLFCKLITNSNIYSILSYLKCYVNEVEGFSLEFNINNRESTQQQKAQYRDVRRLSLGQKVVAMLSFILGYSEYSNDYRPLIIDQPEDNLDNQYIYRNLVKQLRDAKGKRQVIIATHSATLVTNTKSEQVCIMLSNGTNGWIDMRGFTGEPNIKKNIINYLEGGLESFKHKLFVYGNILNQ